jgi:hypothetical protein
MMASLVACDAADQEAIQRVLLHRAVDALAALGVEIDQPALAPQVVRILAHGLMVLLAKRTSVD